MESSTQNLNSPLVAPYGTWKSPISAQSLVEGSIRFGDTVLDGEVIYWIESRPQEEGRNVIVRAVPGETPQDQLPSPWNARTTAHEYGGGSFTVTHGMIFFVNYLDQRIYRIIDGSIPEPLTAETPQRFADLVFDRTRNRLIAVREDHSRGGPEPVNDLVSISLDEPTEVSTLVSGHDFYSSPCLRANGNELVWLCWNHPNMPWDATELFMATLHDDGSLDQRQRIAGGVNESVFQPTWSPDGLLYFISDRTNWWNIYRRTGTGEITQITSLQADCGMPQWVFGLSSYAFVTPDLLVMRYSQQGRDHLVRVNTKTKEIAHLSIPFFTFSGIRSTETNVFSLAGSPQASTALISVNIDSAQLSVIRRSSQSIPKKGYTSVPEAIEFPTSNETTAHAFYYPPVNKDFTGPQSTAPPLIVIVHGGPTSSTTVEYSAKVQYWTSRGFAVCDVNYRGSTGYGRDYRNQLHGKWGIADVADAAHAARFLAAEGKANLKQLLIRGGSAGGYTTLAALAFHDVFAAGASYYGISDLSLLAEDTHKFESRYLDRLVGPYPEAKDVYDARSPIHHLEHFAAPVILFQGLEDKVVPPNQAESILTALRKKGVPAAYVPFEGEQHGFRKAENIIRCHEAELYFYGQILGFSPADQIEPVEIHVG